MAKALMGHMANDHHLYAQIASLRARVRVLETQLADLQTEQCNEAVVLPMEAELSELVDAEHATRVLA
jgi:cell division protein FtsB